MTPSLIFRKFVGYLIFAWFATNTSSVVGPSVSDTYASMQIKKNSATLGGTRKKK
jgi:hypothetical protein